MEFVSHDDLKDLLDAFGVEEVAEGADRVYLRMTGVDNVVNIHLTSSESSAEPLDSAKVLTIEKDRLATIIEHSIHLLHLTQVLVVPAAKWRKVFDAVAFSLADNEDWQEFDTSATVELNSRDPLLCEPADFHTLIALIGALVRDAESPDQGLMFLSTASPVLVEVIPDGAVRISLGSQVLADELAEAFA